MKSYLMFVCRHFQPEKMSESAVSENPSVVVGDQQRPDTIRYHQTVTTDPTIYHQYRADVNQNKTLPHPHFPILLPHPHHIGNITAAF